MFESVRFGAGSEKIRVFVSYDREHDGDLHDQLVDQAAMSPAGFEISARSRAWASADFLDEGLRREIRAADEAVRVVADVNPGSPARMSPLFRHQQVGGSNCRWAGRSARPTIA